MQLGTRWPVGGTVPPNLPIAVVDSIRAVESELTAGGVDATQWRWTLTWLERRPVVELDDGTVIRYDAEADVAEVWPPEA